MQKNSHITINGKIYSHLSIHSLTIDFPTQLSREVVGFLQTWFDKEDTLVQQSSGSTGTPKKLRLNKQAMESSALMTGNFFGFQEGMKAFLCLSPSYIAGKMMILRALIWKLNLILGETDSNPVKNLNETIDFAAMVPLQLAKIMEQNPEKLNNFNTIIIGGSAIPVSLEQKLTSFKTNFYHTYGMTKTMSHIALRKITESHSENYFKPLTGIHLTQDKRGCLIIQADDWRIKKLVTNDLVELLPDQNFRILGRWDEVIISGGLKIHPQLIEQKLSQHLSKPFVLIGKAHETAGEIAILIIEDQPVTAHIFKYWQLLENILEPAEMPRELYFIKSIPQLSSGKPDRKSIQKII